jgi:hypothetical protein
MTVITWPGLVALWNHPVLLYSCPLLQSDLGPVPTDNPVFEAQDVLVTLMSPQKQMQGLHVPREFARNPQFNRDPGSFV